jgi:type IV pilus assembly protein PilN
MIRINLLPTDKKKRARRIAPSPMPSGDLNLGTWAAIYAGAIAIWLVVLGALYFAQSGEVDTIAQENKTLEARRDELKSKTKGLSDVESRLEKSRKLEKVVQELERARRGPTRAVMELSKVLSSPGGPSINAAELERMRQDNPLAGFNESWDVRRLWITSFEEIERECKIVGMGRSNEDV